MNECGPEAGVVGKIGMRRKVGARTALGKKLGGNLRGHRAIYRADEVDGAGEIFAVDDDFYLIAIAEFAECPSREGFGRDVADAGSGGDTTEASRL